MNNDSNEKRVVGRPQKGLPEPLDMTAEQVAKMMFKLPNDDKRKDEDNDG